MNNHQETQNILMEIIKKMLICLNDSIGINIFTYKQVDYPKRALAEHEHDKEENAA